LAAVAAAAALAAARRGVFLLYLLVGTWLEERKLLAEFGAAYARYRREVPALFPWRALGRRRDV
jgi:protein-S-isoprenylcysteine O-methyltransferase Ste14